MCGIVIFRVGQLIGLFEGTPVALISEIEPSFGLVRSSVISLSVKKHRVELLVFSSKVLHGTATSALHILIWH